MSMIWLAFKLGPTFDRLWLDRFLPSDLNPVGVRHVEMLFSVPCEKGATRRGCELCARSQSRAFANRHWLSWWVAVGQVWEELVDDDTHRNAESRGNWRYLGVPVRDKLALVEFMRRKLVGRPCNPRGMLMLGFSVPRLAASSDASTGAYFCSEGIAMALAAQGYDQVLTPGSGTASDISPTELYRRAHKLPHAQLQKHHPAQGA